MWPFNNKVNEVSTVSIPQKPSAYFGETVVGKLNEQFKGEVENKKVKFPTDLGEEHPFDFKMMEELYKKFGFFSAVIDKYVDFVVGPGFYITIDDERAKKILEDFMKDVNFDTLLRQWTKEALIKGNGYLEIGGSKEKGVEGLKLLNANYMYVNRDSKGKILNYNQYKGAFNKFAKEKVIGFNPDQVAHAPFNIIGDCAYGLGIGYSSLKLIDDWLSQQKSQHVLMDRKANAPLHAQIGYINGDTKILPKPEDVASFGKDMETMSNKTEWTTDALVNFKVIDFGNMGEKFQAILENDLEMLIYSFQIPAVLLGKGNIPEGLARVQMEAFQRRIQSIQAELEKIIENQILSRVLEANGFSDLDVEFEWGIPSVMETEGKLNIMSELIKSPTTSIAMRNIMEDELIALLKLDADEWEKTKLEQEGKAEEERQRLETQPTPIVPGQNAKFPQPVAPKKEQPKQPKAEAGTEIILSEIKKMKEEWNERFQLLEKKKIIKKNILPKKLKEVVKPKIKTSNVLKRQKENYEHARDCKHCNESWGNVNDVQEWLGFNYKKYLGQIKKEVASYDFNYIKAINEIELAAGYLATEQVETLRGIIDNGFAKGLGMKEMAKQVDKKVGLKDLYRMNEGEIKLGASGLPLLSRSAEKRSIGIIRSEVTRLANAGAVEYYKESGIQKVSWIASFGDRTCPDCESLNGQIYEINNHPDIPLHPMCRCTISPVVDLK